MTIEAVRRSIDKQRPSLIHLSGKTSTGKSTLARSLHDDFGYELIEMDHYVRDIVMHPHQLPDEGKVFNEVYRERHRIDWITEFVAAVQEAVHAQIKNDQHLILDGAISNIATLQQLLSDLPPIQIIFLHPKNLSIYERNLTSRFMTATQDHNASLPRDFWKLVDHASFTRFCESRTLTPDITAAIHQYAVASQEHSTHRLSALQHAFPDLMLVEI